jgi:hypothetical protein
MRSVVAGGWLIGERTRVSDGGWVSVLVVPLRGRGRYCFGWNGERMSASADNERFERDYPGELAAIIIALRQHFPMRGV